MEQIERIVRMEEYLDESEKVLKEFRQVLGKYEGIQEKLKLLDSYYGSYLWMEDYEADEAGKLPADLKRGVLSVDAVYDLLEDNHDAVVRMLRIALAESERR